MRTRLLAAGLLMCLAACSATADPTASGGEASPRATPTTAATPSRPSSSESPTPAPSPSPGDAATLSADSLALTTVADLSVRRDASVGADLVGTLPAGEPVYVVQGPVESDGYDWYQLASVRVPYRGDCGDPAQLPSLECANWVGWVAAADQDGEPWLEPRAVDCPPARDTAAYVELLPAERLACAGNGEWRLIVYIAPEAGGRGCYPVWVTMPGWLDASCNFLFPQPEESRVDADERLQTFVHPDLGACRSGTEGTCPFSDYRGAWVEMVAHLDDPAAPTCRSQPSGLVPDDQLPPAPDPALTVFECRLRLVVIEVSPAEAP